MRKRFHLRISNNVYREEDFPIIAIYIRGNNPPSINNWSIVKLGIYEFPNMVNWTLQQLFDWLNKSSPDNQLNQEYHEIGLYDHVEEKFYPADGTFNIQTIHSRWAICKTCNRVTIYNTGYDECIQCNKFKNDNPNEDVTICK